MVDKEKLLLGRKVVEEYREAHAKLYEKKAAIYDHAPLAAQLIARLTDLGFQSIDDFFETNKQANFEVFIISITQVIDCDDCVGKSKACSEGCQAQMAKTGLRPQIGRHGGRGLMAILNSYKPDHWAPHLPLKLGDEFPILPGCSIIVKVVKEPEIDWTWR